MRRLETEDPYYDKTRCLVLDVSRVAEADKSALLATEKFGKISAVAPGAFKVGARLSSSIEPLRDVEIDIWRPAHHASKNGSMFGVATARTAKNSIRIISASTVEPFGVFLKDKNKISAAFECARIYDALTPYMEPDDGKGYFLLRRAFELLAKCPSKKNDDDVPTGLSPALCHILITSSYALRVLRLSGYDFCSKSRPSYPGSKNSSADGNLRDLASRILLLSGESLIENAFGNNGKDLYNDGGALVGKLFLSIKNYVDEIAQGKV